MGKRRPAKPVAPQLPKTLHGAVADAELDLHGSRAAQALQRVEHFLTRWDGNRSGSVLRIITGKGNRSPGAPVLLDAVGDRLRDELGGRVVEMVRDAGGGGWLVRLRG